MTSLGSSKVWAGRAPGINLSHLILERAEVFEGLPYVIVSTVDSDSGVSRMPWAAARIRDNADWALSVTPLVISGQDLVRLAHDSIFHGFDEIWVTAEKPTISPPADVYLVAPRELKNPAPDAVQHWMKSSGSRLGLGDGDGLNFVVADIDLGRQLHLPIF